MKLTHTTLNENIQLPIRHFSNTNINDRSAWISLLGNMFASMSGAMVQCVQMVPGPKGFMQAMD
jgi:hypothetical protein